MGERLTPFMLFFCEHKDAVQSFKTSHVDKRAKRTFKKLIGEAWYLVANAAEDQKADVIDCVRQLASSEGRATLSIGWWR